jgi:hypothetical protein
MWSTVEWGVKSRLFWPDTVGYIDTGVSGVKGAEMDECFYVSDRD